jgi:hypothetical protein
MNCIVKNSRLVLTVMLLLLATLNGCSSGERYAESNFVGKWQSSRETTPIYLYENGEWELKTDDGVVQQYGVWQYFDNKIMWSVRVDSRIVHDPNAVLSVTPGEFQLREKDGSVTTFRKLG